MPVRDSPALQAALGPLQSEAVVGTLTWSLRAVEGGTEIVQTYVVGGYMRGGLEPVAPLVDQVMSDQLAGSPPICGHPPDASWHRGKTCYARPLATPRLKPGRFVGGFS